MVQLAVNFVAFVVDVITTCLLTKSLSREQVERATLAPPLAETLTPNHRELIDAPPPAISTLLPNQQLTATVD